MGGFVTSAALSAMEYVVDEKQRKAESKVEQAAAQSEAASEVAQIQQAEAIEKAERQDRLRRALATQRARFGAQGTGRAVQVWRRSAAWSRMRIGKLGKPRSSPISACSV
jgi:RNA 3'-terminal phosphate cyclase